MPEIKFFVKYVFIMIPIMTVVAVLGHFLRDMLNDFLPDDGIDVYPSREAAYAAAYRGERIMDKIEILVIFALAYVVFMRMKNKNNEKKEKEGQ